MPASTSVLKAIERIRNIIAGSGSKRDLSAEVRSALSDLFRQQEEIVGDIETLGTVLAFATEIETYRGKGSRPAKTSYLRRVGWLVHGIHARLSPSKITTDRLPQEEELLKAADALACLQALAAHIFARTQGPPVRSRYAAHLRVMAWDILGDLVDTIRRPEHLAHAHKVAADPHSSTEERMAAIGFLSEYWSYDAPDEEEAAGLLDELMKSPPSRSFLVAVLQIRIDLGLDSEFGALSAVDDWDDAEEE